VGSSAGGCGLVWDSPCGLVFIKITVVDSGSLMYPGAADLEKQIKGPNSYPELDFTHCSIFFLSLSGQGPRNRAPSK
jgi:hypothetical protein